MQTLANQVYLEDQYPGVTLGAIALPHGLVQIDAPPSPEDCRSWRAALLGLNSGAERLLINLDSHPDRTLGARAMDCTILGHEKTVQAFRNRPNTFKAQGEETGADWESVVGLGSIRWAPPEISFTSVMTIEWSNCQVVIEHHPGPASGACWVILPETKIIFVGDLVVKNQPPFLANANLPEWLTALDHLLANYSDYTVVSSRGGVVTEATVLAQRTQIASLHEKLESLSAQPAGLEAVESLVQPVLAGLKISTDRQKQSVQRLSYGLRHYYARHYRPAGTVEPEEE